MGEVLVKQAVEAQYPVGAGAPILVLGGGRGGSGGQARGTTMRERAGGLAGGLVGVLGALGGQQRSLGGLAQSAISGGAQGAALGRSLGRMTVGRVGQARADMREAGRQARAEERARLAEATRARGEGFGSSISPAAALRRRQTRIRDEGQQELERVNRANQARLESQQQVSDYLVGQEKRRREGREKVMGTEEAQREMDAMRSDSEIGQNMKDILSSMGMSDSEINAAFQQGGAAARQGQKQQQTNAVRVVGGKVLVNNEELQPDEQGNYSAPGININGSAVMGGGKKVRDDMNRAMGEHFAAGGKPGDAAAAMKEAMKQSLAQQNDVRVVTTADGRQVGDANQLAAQPANSRIGQPVPGSVSSGNESADPQGTQVNAAVGLNTDNEQVTPNAMQPPQGQEQLPNANEQAFEAMRRLSQEKERREKETRQMMGAGEDESLGKFGMTME
jgi:hypothetical protein